MGSMEVYHMWGQWRCIICGVNGGVSYVGSIEVHVSCMWGQ